MPSINDLNTVKQFLNTLSWKKIAQMTVFIIVITLSWLLFEARNSIINFVTQDVTHVKAVIKIKPELSKTTKNMIDLTVDKSELIIGIIVVSVDFQKNTRQVIYVKTDEPSLMDTAMHAMQSSLEIPLFNSDPINNKRMTDVINGEFICTKYSDTISAQIYPETKKSIETICISGIPPYYGAFNGVVGIITKRALTTDEIDQLRVISRNISSTIYDKETSTD